MLCPNQHLIHRIISICYSLYLDCHPTACVKGLVPNVAIEDVVEILKRWGPMGNLRPTRGVCPWCGKWDSSLSLCLSLTCSLSLSPIPVREVNRPLLPTAPAMVCYATTDPSNKTIWLWTEASEW